MQLIPFTLLCVYIGGRMTDASPYIVPKLVTNSKEQIGNVLEYYKLYGNSNKDSVSSVESKEVDDDSSKKPSYRLEFSGDESSPYASYKYEEEKIIVQNQSDSVAVPTEMDAVEVTTIYPSVVKPVNGSGKLDTFNDDDASNTSSAEDGCPEGELKKVDCNTCVCSDGSYFCSKKKCAANMTGTHGIYLEDSFMSHEQLAEKKEQMLESLNMMNKKSWKLKTKSTTPLPDCSSGMTKSIDCNQCVCAQQKWACTKRSCIALTLREKASYTDGTVMKQVETLKENHHLDDDCLEDETRKLGCNHCVCHWNSWSCTNVPCDDSTMAMMKPIVPAMEEVEEACQKEADVKSKDCNICKCRRGVWVCTMNDCQKLGDKDAEPPSFRSKISEKDI